MEAIVQAARNLKVKGHDYESVRDFLYGLRYHGAKYGLDRMRAFAELMGNPQSGIPTIHVAGTNGKGSTCAMLEQVLRNHGFKTGFYSSPHLIRQGERIQVNREILSEEDIQRLTFKMVDALLQDPQTDSDGWPSFFEFMTVMGFVRFAEEQVDVAVIETGLGGRLDATNILLPELSIITSISLDHVQILGDTLEKIAFEKAGIIKPGVPLVMGYLPRVAEDVVRKVAEQMHAPVYSIIERFGKDVQDYPSSNLTGEYQRINAAIALLACDVLNHSQSQVTRKHTICLEQARASLNQVSWPGRWETVLLHSGSAKDGAVGSQSTTPHSVEIKPRRLILDATHNEEGARMLELNLARLVGELDRGIKPIIVVGSLGEERAKSLMAAVCRYADTLYLLHPHQPRALTFEQLRSCIPPDFGGNVIDAKVEELFSYQDTSIPLHPNQPLVVTGSIYLIGEVSDLLKSTPVANQHTLQDVV